MEETYQATPHETLIEQIMDSTIPKSEREWAAAREIEKLQDIILRFHTFDDKNE